MHKLMIIVGSVRPGRIGLPISRWVEQQASEHGGFEIDFVDLAELALPFMDEPNHPSQRKYTKPHTFAWSERVDAADAVILVSPEYNHSYSPALKNSLDYLSQEWWRKPVGIVSYGGVSAGSRSVVGLEPVLTTIGLVKTGASVEIPFAGKQVVDGVFAAGEKETAILAKMLTELDGMVEALRPLR